MKFLSNTLLQSLDIPVPVDCHCCGSPLLQLDPSMHIRRSRCVYMFGNSIVVTCHTCSPRIDDGRLTTSHFISKTGETNGRVYTAYDGNWNGFIVDDDSVEFNNNLYYNVNIVAARLLASLKWQLHDQALSFCKP